MEHFEAPDTSVTRPSTPHPGGLGTAALQRRLELLEAQHEADQALIAHLRDDALEYCSKIAHLETALVSSRRIGTAIGVIMMRYRVTDAAAFELLRKASQNGHLKLRDLAEGVILIGELPGEEPKL